MNAATPIAVRPVLRPRYDNTYTDWQRWYGRNEPALAEYYHALTPHVERPDEHDFMEFAMCQFDCAIAGLQS